MKVSATFVSLALSAAVASVNAYSKGFDLSDRASMLHYYHPAVPTLPAAQTKLPAECEVDQVYAIVRHMTRYPSRGSYNGCIAASNRIAETIAAGKLPVAPELQFLKNWNFSDVVPDSVSMPENITKLGLEEGKQFGETMLEKYPKLFNEQTTMWSGSVERVQLTAKAFMDGYFGPKAAASGYKNLVTSNSKDTTLGGNTLTPIDTCPAFVKDSLADAPSAAYKKTVEAKFVARMESLWPGYGFTIDDALGMMDICMYEMNILGKDQKRFCKIFTDEEWEIYAYNKDIGYYYGSSWGNPLARTVGYPIISAIANLMSQPTTASCQNVYVAFTHDTQINTFLTTMGLVEDKNFSSSPSRIYHSSRLTPMGARLVTERLKCGNKRYVRVSVNEAVHAIPGCTSGPGSSCPLEEYVAKIGALQQTVGDFAKTCNVTSGAGSKFELFDKPLNSLCKRSSTWADAWANLEKSN